MLPEPLYTAICGYGHSGRVRSTLPAVLCDATMLSGGHAENALPQTATATVNCRMLPDEKPDAVLKAITDAVADPQVVVAPRVLPYMDSVWRLLDQKRREGKRILFEGAQGALLDIDHGTYPFVTSSNTVAAQAATGSGLGPSAIDYVLGICKAYTTRVGEGPFPTEQKNDIGRLLGERGHEFGTVTGRPRRCGWFDAVLVRQTVRTSGISGLALTKLDILDGLPEIKVCVAYRLDGREIDYLPASDELEVVAMTTTTAKVNVEPVTNAEEIIDFQQLVRMVPIADSVARYAVDVVRASRPVDPTAPDFVKKYINFGASVRAAQFLVLAAKARALMKGRYHVTYEDVRSLYNPVLRHRILLNFHAESDRLKQDDILKRVLEWKAAPRD